MGRGGPRARGGWGWGAIEDILLNLLPLMDHFQKNPQGICCTHHHRLVVFPLPQRQQLMSNDFQALSPPSPEPFKQKNKKKKTQL